MPAAPATATTTAPVAPEVDEDIECLNEILTKANSGAIDKKEVLQKTQTVLAQTDMISKVNGFTVAKRERIQFILQKLMSFSSPG